ncbi:hypothetical protein Rsl_1584 [Rickettsia slovaca 13-B]|uniref:Uncharacterized protein n=1 Tax=Rickettsia slovaca (strain 13-B) TaxID=941638 RepID=A0ABM5MR18_RICS1|nr:hypothetical protein Rsl_1584 [Rickettsia slovaca 13-B]
MNVGCMSFLRKQASRINSLVIRASLKNKPIKISFFINFSGFPLSRE